MGDCDHWWIGGFDTCMDGVSGGVLGCFVCGDAFGGVFVIFEIQTSLGEFISGGDGRIDVSIRGNCFGDSPGHGVSGAIWIVISFCQGGGEGPGGSGGRRLDGTEYHRGAIWDSFSAIVDLHGVGIVDNRYHNSVCDGDIRDNIFIGGVVRSGLFVGGDDVEAVDNGGSTIASAGEYWIEGGDGDWIGVDSVGMISRILQFAYTRDCISVSITTTETAIGTGWISGACGSESTGGGWFGG